MSVTQLGKFRIDALLGHGGMSIVYAALDGERGLPVALKVLRTDVLQGDGGRRRLRFIREAQALSLIRHPNVVEVYGAGEIDGHVYVAMQLIGGGTLGGWLAAGPRPWTEVLAMVIQAGRGLEAAHAVGLVHRDFKPSNVLIGVDGIARVTDFGLARLVLPTPDPEQVAQGNLLAANVTRTGAVLGTPRYMAPEQHLARGIGTAADQFSFCVVLYEALYGLSPFAIESRDDLPDALSIALAAVEGRIRPPPAGVVPPRIGELVRHGLRAEPGDRFASIGRLLDALEQELTRLHRRERSTTLAAAFVVASGLAVAVGWPVLAGGGRSPEAGAACADRPASVWPPADVKLFTRRFAAAAGTSEAASWPAFSAAMAAYASALERVRGATCAGPRSAEAAIQLECLDTRRGEVERLIAASRTAPPAAAAASVGLLVSPTACGENAHRAELRLAEWTRSLAAGAAAFVPADDDADGRAAAAKLAYARGDLASARSHAERLMELRGGDAGAAEIAGLVALASGDDRRAGEIFSNAPAPSSARAAAMAKARAGGWQEALALLDRSIDALGAEGRASDPDLARHLIDRGWINKRLGRADAARADFERALAVARETSAWASGPENPEAAAARVGLGVLALDASQPAEAAEPLLAALALREQVRGDPLALAEARFLAARALHESDRDPARARELATRARIAAAEAGARGDLLGTAIERWLAANQTR